MTGRRRDALAGLLLELQHDLESQFVRLAGADKRGSRVVVQRRLLLGIELLSKLEEQTVLPAIGRAEPAAGGAIAEALREIEMMRDVALLARHTARGNRDLALTVLEGMAMLHFAHIDELLARDGAQAVNWHQLEREARALLMRWQAEVRIDGEVEDEDGDPVGAAAR